MPGRCAVVYFDGETGAVADVKGGAERVPVAGQGPRERVGRELGELFGKAQGSELRMGPSEWKY